ncbi:MAG: hypothetical protein QOC38_10430, partial [Nitrososphaeraceae archaeon]|nr:hypothetical protein [Nitrososphaeraceae archaeon]
IFDMAQPTALPIIYPMRRIMPAAIIRGMAATACAKNSFREFRAGATTAELFPCKVVSAILKFKTSSISNITVLHINLNMGYNSLYEVSMLISFETEISRACQ